MALLFFPISVHFALLYLDKGFGGFEPLFRIWMDPGFIADPDPDFKNPDPDPSVFAIIYEKSTNEN